MTRSLHALRQAQGLIYALDIEALADRDPDAEILASALPSEDELYELHEADTWLFYLDVAGLPQLPIPAHVARLAPPRAALIIAAVLARQSLPTSDADLLAAFPRPGTEPPQGLPEATVEALRTGLIVQDQDGCLWGAGRKAA